MTLFFVMLKKHWRVVKKHLLVTALLAIPFSLGGPLYITAVAESSASYVSILLLLTPVVFGIISTIVTRDKVTKGSLVGILLAVLGGTLVILMPSLSEQPVGFVGLSPALLLGVYILLHAAFPVAVRRENESGMPLIMAVAINYFFGAITSIVWAASTVGSGVFDDMAKMNWTDWGLILYLSVGFCVILRGLSILAYEKVGTSTSVAMNYLGQVGAVIFPVLVIGETVSWEMAVGAILIIVGIILTRRHHSKYHQAHRSHA
jgi:drug/metabolite transporter (DMT)-like permease